MQAGTAPKLNSWPAIEIRDGLTTSKISVGHLQKSGQFREDKEGQSSTEVKEGLVSLFFALNHNIPVTKENFDQIRDQLRGAIEEQPEGETKPALEDIIKYHLEETDE